MKERSIFKVFNICISSRNPTILSASGISSFFCEKEGVFEF